MGVRVSSTFYALHVICRSSIRSIWTRKKKCGVALWKIGARKALYAVSCVELLLYFRTLEIHFLVQKVFVGLIAYHCNNNVAALAAGKSIESDTALFALCIFIFLVAIIHTNLWHETLDEQQQCMARLSCMLQLNILLIALVHVFCFSLSQTLSPFSFQHTHFNMEC